MENIKKKRRSIVNFPFFVRFHIFDNINTMSMISSDRDKLMADKSMNIPNDDTQNYPFYRLQLVVETFTL